MLNLLEVTAEKRTLDPTAGLLPRQRLEIPKDIHPWDTSSSEAKYLLAGRYQRPKNLWDPRAGPLSNHRPENPSERHPVPVSGYRTKNLGPLMLEASAG
jgi:hypothetical protein